MVDHNSLSLWAVATVCMTPMLVLAGIASAVRYPHSRKLALLVSVTSALSLITLPMCMVATKLGLGAPFPPDRSVGLFELFEHVGWHPAYELPRLLAVCLALTSAGFYALLVYRRMPQRRSAPSDRF